ncbi:hypothetical protein WH47_07992 [Habropoda laboriosa]|uniref:O-acyltransferase WSD1 C-terminal domain-containing protein n=1 Tax=Habropoda laboriosa TaxID=597456 RepID=A0A0L7QQ64_9HYME|nr:PREDICTED: uncharacterized protein LOC108576637 [Habropoda laboriosa]KOC60631.1 hypothetical protein WH47_07992 [Habropoda laboriosa]
MSKIHQALLTFYTCLFSPLIILVLLCSYLYRRIVEIILRIQLKNKFAGLLDGTDCVWAVEEQSALSVNNILLIIEKDARHSNINFLESFRDLARNRIINSSYDKLLYKRKRKFGYYFWERSEEIDLRERVRWLEYERSNCDGSCDNIYNGHLKRVLWNVCNQPLPEDHTASWEILIGKCCPRSSHHYLRRMEERLTSKIKIPVLFRVHHSLGDGMALLKFFRDVIIDKEPVPETTLELGNSRIQMKSEKMKKLNVTVSVTNSASLIGDNSLQCSYQKDVISACMPFIHFVMFSHFLKLLRGQFDDVSNFLSSVTFQDVILETKEFMNRERERWYSFYTEVVRKKVYSWLKITKIIVDLPGCLVQQAFRSMDKSALHGAELSGEKLVSYWLEDDFKNPRDQKLFVKIQNIKSITGARFGDVLLAALSVSLHKYFLRMDEPVPTKLSVILPMKIEEWSENHPLQNNISVGILPLCISQINDKQLADPAENCQILDRLEDIKRANDALRKSSDYVVNFLVMKYLSAVLPEKLLQPIFKSHSTMVFSNLVGPLEVKILGLSLKNIVFWIPNRSYTGIGCSLLTYRGYLHLSLIADKALVQNEKALTKILENTVTEIDNLYDRLTLSFFSKKLHRSMSTPTKKGRSIKELENLMKEILT